MNIISLPKNNKEKVYLILIFLVCIFSLILSMNFTLDFIITLTEKAIHRTLRDHTKWINILSGVIHIPFLISLILFFNNFTQLGIKTNDFYKTEKEKFKLFISKKETKILFLFLIVFFIFATKKLISADILFEDDISRNHDGDRNWISYGRYISEFLSILIHCTINLTDIAPLTQYISIVLMAITIVVLLFCIAPETKHPYLSAIPLTFIFLSPYFQDCFLFRFDSPYMVLAVLFPILPFIFKDNLYAYSYTGFISLILGCMCYQAGTSVFIIVVIYITYKKVINGENIKKIIKFVIASILIYALSLLIYQFLFSANTTRTYSDNYYSTKLSLKEFIPNLKTYFSIIVSETGGLLTKACIVICLIISAFISVKKSKYNKLITTVVLFLFLCLAFILSTGPYILFERTMLIGRTFMGINCLIAIILFSTIDFITDCNKIKFIAIPAILCIYSSISYLYTLGNCLSEQKNYNEFRYQLIYDDLNDIVDPENTIYISFKNDVGYCNAFETAVTKYPHLIKTLQIMPANGTIWNTDYSYRFNFMFEDDESENIDLPLIKTTYYHDIFGSNNHFMIDLHNHN